MIGWGMYSRPSKVPLNSMDALLARVRARGAMVSKDSPGMMDLWCGWEEGLLGMRFFLLVQLQLIPPNVCQVGGHGRHHATAAASEMAAYRRWWIGSVNVFFFFSL